MRHTSFNAVLKTTHSWPLTHPPGGVRSARVEAGLVSLVKSPISLSWIFMLDSVPLICCLDKNESRSGLRGLSGKSEICRRSLVAGTLTNRPDVGLFILARRRPTHDLVLEPAMERAAVVRTHPGARVEVQFATAALGTLVEQLFTVFI
jgi:hypothetical protein